MTLMMRAYPNLPLLSIEQCLQVFGAVGLPNPVLARLSGFSRMQFYRWRNGESKKPHSSSIELVSALAYKVLRAVKAGQSPKKDAKNPLKAWADAINDDAYPVSLLDMDPHDLLPKAWIESFNLPPRHQDAAA